MVFYLFKRCTNIRTTQYVFNTIILGYIQRNPSIFVYHHTIIHIGRVIIFHLDLFNNYVMGFVHTVCLGRVYWTKFKVIFELQTLIVPFLDKVV